MPDDILEMVQYARSKGVALCAYVYPCLPFEQFSEHWTQGRDPNTLDISAPEVQRWMTDTMIAFVEKSGAGGFAWDHDIFVPKGGGQYAQWRAWMEILQACAIMIGGGAPEPARVASGRVPISHSMHQCVVSQALRERFPDIVMDHRQTNHRSAGGGGGSDTLPCASCHRHTSHTA